MDKLVPLESGILFSSKKKLKERNEIKRPEETYMHITKYEKPDQKRYILHDFNSRNSGKNKTMETAKDE